MKTEIFFTLSVVILGLYGFLLASHIYFKKAKKTKLVCPMRTNCDTVIHSQYSSLFGVPIEILGMIYYAFVSGFYGLLFFFGPPSLLLSISLLWISLGAVVFSLYLVCIQGLVLKQWCSWCLMSAGTTTLIFLVSYWHFFL